MKFCGHRARAIRRAARLEMWERLGTLYRPYWDEVEASKLRYHLEQAGIPCGYGRVGRQPVQLTDGEATSQFAHFR